MGSPLRGAGMGHRSHSPISPITNPHSPISLFPIPQGKRFNHPNDLVQHSSGALYFTDPPPGLSGEDKPPEQELDFAGVFRLDPDGKLTLLTTELNRPNGIAFSPDEKTLYVTNQRKWMAYDIQPDGSIANGRVFFDATDMEGTGGSDGMKSDSKGNLYCTGPGGVLIFTPDGKHLGTIQLPEQPSNVAWGDADGKTLYITARTNRSATTQRTPSEMNHVADEEGVARPERFELPTTWFEVLSNLFEPLCRCLKGKGFS